MLLHRLGGRDAQPRKGFARVEATAIAPLIVLHGKHQSMEFVQLPDSGQVDAGFGEVH